MYIPRAIENQIIKKIKDKKVIVIYGSRQAGKTTLVKKISQQVSNKFREIKIVTGEDLETRRWLSSQSVSKLKEFIGKTDLLIIDEAQRIENIGLNLKLIADQIPEVKIIATGSSSFELSKQVGEPLVGRKWQFTLYTLSQLELGKIETPFETKQNLEKRMIFGSYPEVIVSQSREDKREILGGILDNYLFRDLLVFQDIRRADKLVDLLRLLAFQIGKEVSLRELSSNLNLNVVTVEKYLDLLEKVFVIKRIFGFSRNLRKEVTKNSRFYFLDNGIRNVVINNFNSLEMRNDCGELWENYLFSERLKKQEYQNIYANNYFWRTYDQKEIDWVEEREGKLFGFEFKWSEKIKIKTPKEWLATYSNASFEVVNRENYSKFIG